MPLQKSDKIFVAGHRGMVGSAIVRKLEKLGYLNIVTVPRDRLDLREQSKCRALIREISPDYIFLAAATVGGIHANNSRPAEFISDNLLIQTNLIGAAYEAGVRDLLFLGSSCIYPKYAPQPMREESLLEGALEPTNEPYAIAKIAGIKLCESFNRQYAGENPPDYRSVMPTNLYGPHDNFSPLQSHVIPALLWRFMDARSRRLQSVTVWGSGRPRREFLHVDDLADACVFVAQLDKNSYQSVTNPMLSHLNVGSGTDISIENLALMIKDLTGFEGSIIFDNEKPDGPILKQLDSSKLNKLGWSASIDLEQGITETFEWAIKAGVLP